MGIRSDDDEAFAHPTDAEYAKKLEDPSVLNKMRCAAGLPPVTEGLAPLPSLRRPYEPPRIRTYAEWHRPGVPNGLPIDGRPVIGVWLERVSDELGANVGVCVYRRGHWYAFDDGKLGEQVATPQLWTVLP